MICLFLSLLIAVCNSSVVISGILVISSVLLLCTSVLLSFSFSPISCSDSSCSLSSFFFVEFSKDLGNSFSRCDAFPLSFFIFVMRAFFFADLVSGMFLTPSKSSSILWMSCCRFNIFFVSDTFFDAFAHFFQSLFLFFGCTSPQFDESSDFHVFFLKVSLEFLPSLRYRCCFARLCCYSCRHHSLHVQSRLSRCPRKVFCRIYQRHRQFLFEM